MNDVIIRIVLDGMRNVQQDIGGVGASFTNLGRQLTSAGRALSLAFTVPMAAASTAAIRLALDAQQTATRFDQSFGAMSETARDFASTLSTQLRLNQSDVEAMMEKINLLAKSMGLSHDAAQEVAQGLTKMSFDMAAFRDMSPDQVFTALSSAIAGKALGLRQLGIVMDDTMVKQTLMNAGLATEGQELSSSQEAMGRYLTILSLTAQAQDSWASKMATPTGMMRTLKTVTADTSETLGAVLMPSFTKALKLTLSWSEALQHLVVGLSNLNEPLRTILISVGAFVATLGPTLIVLGGLSTVIGSLFTLLKGGLGVMAGFFALVVANPFVALGIAVAAAVGALAIWIANTKQAVPATAELNKMGEAFADVMKEAKEAATQFSLTTVGAQHAIRSMIDEQERFIETLTRWIAETDKSDDRIERWQQSISTARARVAELRTRLEGLVGVQRSFGTNTALVTDVAEDFADMLAAHNNRLQMGIILTEELSVKNMVLTRRILDATFATEDFTDMLSIHLARQQMGIYLTEELAAKNAVLSQSYYGVQETAEDFSDTLALNVGLLEEHNKHIANVNFENLHKGWGAVRKTAEETFAHLADLGQQGAQLFTRTFMSARDALSDLFVTGKFGWDDMMNAWKRAVADFVSNWIMGKLGQALLSIGSGAGGGFGGFLSGIGGMIGKGAAGAGGASAAAGGVGGLLGGIGGVAAAIPGWGWALGGAALVGGLLLGKKKGSNDAAAIAARTADRQNQLGEIAAIKEAVAANLSAGRDKFSGLPLQMGFDDGEQLLQVVGQHDRYNARSFATGGRGIFTRPSLIEVAEAGPEVVDVSPLRGGRHAGPKTELHIHGPAVFDDISAAKWGRQFARMMQRQSVRGTA